MVSSEALPRTIHRSPTPLVNERHPGGVSTIVHNQPPTHPLGNGSMRLPQHVQPDSLYESEAARNMLPRDRTSAVTRLFEAHYVSLVRMARPLVDDRETAEDVVMDAFTSLVQAEAGVSADQARDAIRALQRAAEPARAREQLTRGTPQRPINSHRFPDPVIGAAYVPGLRVTLNCGHDSRDGEAGYCVATGGLRERLSA